MGKRDHLESDDDYRQRLQRFIMSDMDRPGPGHGDLLMRATMGSGEALDQVAGPIEDEENH